MTLVSFSVVLYLLTQGLLLSQSAGLASQLARKLPRLCLLNAEITGRAPLLQALYTGVADLNSGVFTLYLRKWFRGRSEAHKLYTSSRFPVVTEKE